MRRERIYPISYIAMVLQYLRWRREKYGNTSKCFTYEGIMNWAKRTAEYADLERTTVERVIRRLAEEKFLIRVRERPKALFCINEQRIREYLERMQLPIDHEWWE